jgi:hypothetical protein
MNLDEVEQSTDRLRELSQLAARLRSQRGELAQPPIKYIRSISDLERENEELRKKYNAALSLLVRYRNLAREAVARGDQYITLPASPKPQIQTRKNLLKRYLEVNSKSSGDSENFGLAESMNSNGRFEKPIETPDRVEEISALLKSIQRPTLPIGRS